MNKFNKGDLVELIESEQGNNTGVRFIITECEIDNLMNMDGSMDPPTTIYETPLISHDGRKAWAPESWLKRVNPDGDSLSDFTMEELLLDINSNLIKDKS